MDYEKLAVEWLSYMNTYLAINKVITVYAITLIYISFLQFRDNIEIIKNHAFNLIFALILTIGSGYKIYSSGPVGEAIMMTFILVSLTILLSIVIITTGKKMINNIGK